MQDCSNSSASALELLQSFTKPSIYFSLKPGSWFIIKCHLPSIGNPIVETRQSYDHLISTMGFPLLVRWHLYIESGPWWSILIVLTGWKLTWLTVLANHALWSLTTTVNHLNISLHTQRVQWNRIYKDIQWLCFRVWCGRAYFRYSMARAASEMSLALPDGTPVYVSVAKHPIMVSGLSQSYTLCRIYFWKHNVDGLVQERCNSVADTLELRLSCTNPSKSMSIFYHFLKLG